MKVDLLPDGRIGIEAGLRQKELIRQLPGTRFDRDLDTWTMPLTWGACVSLRGLFGDSLVVGSELASWSHREVQERVGPCLALREATDAPGDPRLRPYQRVGAEFLVTAEQALLGDDPGTGKTIQAIAALLQAGPQALPALVVAPAAVRRNWEKELAKWAPDLKVARIVGTPKKRRELIESDADVFIIGWEGLRAHSKLAPYGSVRLAKCAECDPRREDPVTPGRCESHPRELNNRAFATIIADEAHRAKEAKSKQTRALKAVAKGTRYRWALTGTPLPNEPHDLWSVMNFLVPDEYPTRTDFLERYCLTGYNPHGGLEVLGINPRTQDELFKFLDPRWLRRVQEEVLTELPPKVYVTREVELKPAQRKAYKELQKGALTTLDDGTDLLATNPLSLQTRCLQLTSAALESDDDGGVRMTNPSTKLDELEELLDGELTGQSVVVFAVHTQLLELAEHRLTKKGISWASIRGGVSDADRAWAEQRFADRSARVMFLSLAGSEGLTLVTAKHLVRLQRPWDLKSHQQVEGRVYRIGSEQHDQITIWDVVAGDTIDEAVRSVLVDKGERVEVVLRDRERLERAMRGEA